MAQSPLIKNGAFALTANGDLQLAPDIETQMAVSVGAYHCLYGDNLNSLLIPYLEEIPRGGLTRSTITNIVVSAYKPLITQKIITGLTVAVKTFGVSNVEIKVNAVDGGGNKTAFSWTNLL